MLKSMKVALVAATSFAMKAAAFDADFNKSLTELCQENGFMSEQYTLVTEDGYILSIYRIPGKFNDDLN